MSVEGVCVLQSLMGMHARAETQISLIQSVIYCPNLILLIQRPGGAPRAAALLPQWPPLLEPG